MAEPAKMDVVQIDSLIAAEAVENDCTARQMAGWVKREMEAISEACGRLPRSGRSGAQQWLWDNHYSLEREARLCMTELSQGSLRRGCGGLRRVSCMRRGWPG